MLKHVCSFRLHPLQRAKVSKPKNTRTAIHSDDEASGCYDWNAGMTLVTESDVNDPSAEEAAFDTLATHNCQGQKISKDLYEGDVRTTARQSLFFLNHDSCIVALTVAGSCLRTGTARLVCCWLEAQLGHTPHNYGIRRTNDQRSLSSLYSPAGAATPVF
jgi:hypothetical protein